MAKTREKIRHQLRLLFIYPLVYMVIWVMPFVSHVITSDEGDDNAPFGLLVTSLVSLCVQGAVNSVVFSMREKPWRHFRARGGGSGSGGRMGLWPLVRAATEPRRGRGRPAVGRTREEMMLDGRNARMRLEVEIEERKRRDDEAAARRATRQWWDSVDVEAGQTRDDETFLHRY
jgi:G protein-coupled receptor GPR1